MATKGFAIHFGLDKVNDSNYVEKYFREVEPLKYSVKDAEGLAEITRQQGFTEVFLRTNEKATREAFVDLLEKNIARLAAGDLLVISFSGHGGQSNNVMFKDDEPFDGMDELLCFYDDILLDDVFYYHLCQAVEGAKIHIIIDSCHSGGMDKLEGPSAPLKLDLRKFRPESRIKNYSGFDKCQKLKASTLFWAAVSPHELAGNGLFTQTLIRLWHQDQGKLNNQLFYRKLKKNSHPYYKPNQASGNNNQKFLLEKPFYL